MAIHDTFYTNKFQDVRNFYKQEDTAGQVQFIEKTLSLRPRDRILDLACGFGRHSILLAQKGYSVTGYDQSADYIQQAKENAQKGQLDVTFEIMDMRRLNSVSHFDAVLSFSTSLAFYDDDTNEDIFRRIHTALKPAGKFLFDQANIFWFASLVMTGEQSKTEELSDGRIHHRQLSFDAGTCVVSQRSVIEQAQAREESGWDLRYYTLPELRALAKRTQFSVVSTYGDYDCSPYVADSKRLITVMKKL